MWSALKLGLVVGASTMHFSGSSADTLLVRTTTVSLALQALIERLLLRGVLDTSDLAAMRDMGLQLADDLQAHGGTFPQVGGARLQREVVAWWDVIGAPEQHANGP